MLFGQGKCQIIFLEYLPEKICKNVNRRSLQRNLKIMVNKELLRAEGSTNQLIYHLNLK